MNAAASPAERLALVIGQVVNEFNEAGLCSMRDQAGVFIGFAVGALLRGGVPVDQVHDVIMRSVVVALMQAQKEGRT